MQKAAAVVGEAPDTPSSPEEEVDGHDMTAGMGTSRATKLALDLASFFRGLRWWSPAVDEAFHNGDGRCCSGS